MKVIHFTRKPLEGYYSFERVFRDVRAALPAEVKVQVVHAWCHSRGVTGRLLNCLQVLFLRADVVHVTGDINYVLPFLVGRRSVLTVHDLAPLRKKAGWKRWLFRKLWYDWPLACAHAVTTVSAATCRELAASVGIGEERVDVIPNPVDPAFEAKPREWPSRPTVLMVGTKPQKNLERMLQALEGLQVDVLVVGQLTDTQREVVAKCSLGIRETGFVEQDELIAAYQAADLLAFASTYEGFGLPVVEAQATGRPVLTGDIPALREVAGAEGACWVEPMEIDAIRAGFVRILGDAGYRQSLVEHGYENVRSFQCDAVAAKYAAVYSRVCGRGS
jgi:glycosyltransferase involved in cell wall biosynthesis